MAGGKFIEGLSKVRPGLYINFRSAALARISFKSFDNGWLPSLPIKIVCNEKGKNCRVTCIAPGVFNSRPIRWPFL